MRELTSFEMRKAVDRKIRKVLDLKVASVYLQHHHELDDGEMIDFISYGFEGYTVGTQNKLVTLPVERMHWLLDYNNTINERNHEFHLRRYAVVEAPQKL